MSVFLRIATGVVGIAVTGLLIIRSEEVLTLLLNFTAMEFVTNLDDIAFLLAKHEIFWRSVKERTIVIESTKYEIHEEGNAKWWFRIFLFCASLALLFAGWGVIWKRQSGGQYNDQEIFVRMSSDLRPGLVAFSGCYGFRKASDFLRHMRRKDLGPAVYVQTLNGGEHCAFFSYCKLEETWTFTFNGANPCTNWTNGANPCTNWTIKAGTSGLAGPSTAYDLFARKSTNWLERLSDDDEDRNKATVTMNHFELSTTEFNSLISIGDNPTCDNHEVVPTKVGITINKDSQTTRFHDKRYVKLDGKIKNQRKVFSSNLYDEIIVYNGNRWIVINLTDTPVEKGKEPSSLTYFDDEFHFKWSNYKVSFVSDPADGFSDFPTEQLKWYKPSSEDAKFTPSVNGDIDFALRCCAGNGCEEDTNYQLMTIRKKPVGN